MKAPDEASTFDMVNATSEASTLGHLLTYGSLIDAWADNSEKCGIVSWPAKYAMPSEAAKDHFRPPLRVGTDGNMVGLKSLGIHLTGIWWIRDGSSPWGPSLVSFAGATTFDTEFPMRFHVPNTGGHYTFRNSFIGRSTLQAYWGNEPTINMNFTMDSPSSGSIE